MKKITTVSRRFLFAAILASGVFALTGCSAMRGGCCSKECADKCGHKDGQTCGHAMHKDDGAGGSAGGCPHNNMKTEGCCASK